MFTLNIIRTDNPVITFQLDDFTIIKQATDPSNVENGRFIARVFEEFDPTAFFYLTDITDVEKIELFKDGKLLFSSTNFIVPKEIRGYYEMARMQMATEIHFTTQQE